MGDPVTMAVVGGTIGAATSKKPLQGALMGAVGGYAGGSMLDGIKFQPGAGNFINGIGTNAMAGGDIGKGLAINASALAGSSMAGAPMAASAPTAAMSAGETFGSLGSGFSQVGMPEMVASNPFSANAAFSAPMPPPAELSLLDKAAMYGRQGMQALNNNKMVGAMGLSMMKNAAAPRPPAPVLQGQINRGQIAPPQFAQARLMPRKPMSLLG